MRFRVVVLAVAAVFLTAGPALASHANRDRGDGSTARAGGSRVSSTNSSSSQEVSTSGGAQVGVIQGNVTQGATTSSGGSDTSGDGSGSASDGESITGSVSPSASSEEEVAPTNATLDGVVSQFDLPALDMDEETTTSARTSPSVLTWVMALLIIAGLAVLYRRLPRPTRA